MQPRIVTGNITEIH